jgi:hypothetical protein
LEPFSAMPATMMRSPVWTATLTVLGVVVETSDDDDV